MRIPFHKPYLSPRTREYVSQALADGRLSAGGRFTDECQRLLAALTDCPRVLLTQSCTAALEICALLLDLAPGDEVIMPSWTFPSTASAFLRCGAVPVFVDIRPDTLNIDEALIEQAITARTRAIVAVHYAGVPCEMDAINAIAERHGLTVIEDAAQALGSRYKGRPAGTLGHLAAFSFHATKNIGCGEGGALLVNDARYLAAAEEIRDKGTNRAAFLRGEVPHYEWTRPGGAFAPSEISAAVLQAQLEDLEAVNTARRAAWQHHRRLLAPIADRVQLPAPPPHCEHNGHIFWLVPMTEEADALRSALARHGIEIVPHYRPLHPSAVARTAARQASPLPVTERVASHLLRLPVWHGIDEEACTLIARHVRDSLGESPRD